MGDLRSLGGSRYGTFEIAGVPDSGGFEIAGIPNSGGFGDSWGSR